MMRPQDEVELYFKIGGYAKCPSTGFVFLITAIRVDPDNFQRILGNKVGAKRYLYWEREFARPVVIDLVAPVPVRSSLQRIGSVRFDKLGQ